MKKYIFLSFLLMVLLALTGISCKSTPPAEEPKEQSSPAASGEKDPAVTRAEEARKRAIDFECPAYFPTDWEFLEGRYSAGMLLATTGADVEKARSALNSAADEYDALFKKTVPLYAQAREDEIMAAREEVIRSGLPAEFPDYLPNADRIALKALEQYEAENYYAARDTVSEALKEYEILLIGAKALSARNEVVNRGFSEFDLGNFNKAEEFGQKAIDDYDSGNKEGAKTNAEEARLRYSLVVQNSWTTYSSRRRNSASSEKEKALARKANIAARETYREAEIVYASAEDTFKQGHFDEAAILFTEAEARFAVSIQETDEKRARAEDIIRLAEEKIEMSEETAMEAERIIEGGSR